MTFLLSLTPFFQLIELKGYDLLHLLKPASGKERIVVVGIDEPSFAEIGKQWPWPRSLHAKLINILKKEGAAVIGLDVIFSEPSGIEEDKALAGAIRKAGNVVLASDAATLTDKKYVQEMSIQPLPLFQKGSKTGLASVALDRDGVVRRFYKPPGDEKFFSQQVADVYTKKLRKIPSNSLISYAGPPGTFDTISYYQALDPAAYLPEDFFRGKIVLVGKTVEANPDPEKPPADYFATPYFFYSRGSLMSGVEIHANMVNDIIRGTFATRAGAFPRSLLFLSAGLIAALLQTNWRPVSGGVIALASFALCLFLSCLCFAKYDLWVPTLGMSFPVFMPYAFSGMTAYVRSEKRRKEIRRIFSHYLSPAVLESVLSHPERLKLGGERVAVTILFSDIAGFTTTSESMRPEEVAAFLNSYLDEMTRIIFERKGTIDKFIGDAIMAFWGAPAPDPDHALNACLAAVAMQERLKSLRKEFREKGMPEISVRIGINRGEVIAGNMGSSELFDYTVLGDPVNLASRLEGVNKEFGTSIIISRSVHEAVRDSVEARALGTIMVKGKTEEVEIYELLGMNANCDERKGK
jgi:adenylate cyclase